MEANNHETRTLRQELVRQRESFVFETVFSDRAGEKLALVMDAVVSGYNVVLCFIGISGPEISEERVAMRMSQGGHYVPPEKLIIRFPRTVANLKAAIQPLPMVLIFDNDDLLCPSEASLSSVTESPLSLLSRFPNGCVLCLTNSSGSSDAAARRRFAIYSWVSALWCDARASATASERNPRCSTVLRYWH